MQFHRFETIGVKKSTFNLMAKTSDLSMFGITPPHTPTFGLFVQINQFFHFAELFVIPSKAGDCPCLIVGIPLVSLLTSAQGVNWITLCAPSRRGRVNTNTQTQHQTLPVRPRSQQCGQERLLDGAHCSQLIYHLVTRDEGWEMHTSPRVISGHKKRCSCPGLLITTRCELSFIDFIRELA